MTRIEKHTPTGVDLADGEGYGAEGPKRAELIFRINIIFERFQTAFSYFPNLAAVMLSDSQGGVWDVHGMWNEEGELLENLWLSQGREVHIHLDRKRASGYSFVEYMSYVESLNERNSELVLSKTEKIVDGLLKPFEEKISAVPQNS